MPLTCLEPPLLLQKNGPSELIVFLKSTGSGEDFDVKIEIVSTADFDLQVFGIKGTAPSSENSKSFINQNVLVRPGLRKKMLKKLSFSQN